MAIKLVKRISLIILPICVVLLTLNWYNRYLDDQINAFYNDEIGRTYGLEEMNKGLTLISKNADSKHLFIFGSSELDNHDYIEQNAVNMFPNNQLNANVVLVGRSHVQSLIHTMKFAALSDKLKDQNIVIIVSLQWFLGDDIDKAGYTANFSELQFYQIMNNDQIDQKTKQYICERTVKLSLTQSSFERPATYAYLYQKDNLISKIALNILKPYYWGRERFLQLKDKHNSYKLIKKYSNYSVQSVKEIDWNREYLIAETMGKNACTNNDFFVYDEYFTKYLEPNLDTLKNSMGDVDLTLSKEMEDYQILLQTLKQNQLNPYIVFAPTNGRYYDYIGLDREERLNLYDALADITEQYDFKYLDLRDKEYEPYFLKDVMHLGWKGWLYVNQKITEHFS